MACCGRGHCGNVGCECAEGWHGPACNINAATWVLLQNITQAHSQVLLQEARSKREQAGQTRFLSDMLKRATGQQQSASVTAQIQQLNVDIERLLTNAAKSEMQAREELTQNAALQLGDAAKTCSPIANEMSPEEINKAAQMHANLSQAASLTLESLVTASQLNLNVSQPNSFSRRGQVSSYFRSRGAENVKANVSLIGFDDQEAPPPTAKDFGMDNFNPNGKIGIMNGQCTDKDNCNYRGICKDGVCYCQKNYYGPTCGTLRENNTGTIRLAAVAMIALGCTLFSFIFTLCCLNYTAVQRRNAESKLGYVV